MSITFWNSESYFSNILKLECLPLESQASLICSHAVRRGGFLYYIDHSSSQKLTQTHNPAQSPHFTNHRPKNEGCWASEKMEEKKRKWLKVIVLKAWVLFTSSRQFRFELRSVARHRSTHQAHQQRAVLQDLFPSWYWLELCFFNGALVTFKYVTRIFKTFGKIRVKFPASYMRWLTYFPSW